MISWGDAHARAAVAASELHADLGIDLTHPVDVFDAISASPSCSASRPWATRSRDCISRRCQASRRPASCCTPATPAPASATPLATSWVTTTFGHAAEVDLDIEQALRRGDCHTRRPALV